MTIRPRRSSAPGGAVPAAVTLLLVAAVALAGCSSGGGSAGPPVALRSLAEHAARFPIDVGDLHGPAQGQSWPDCFACHADMRSGSRQLPASMKVFTCTGCHLATGGGFDHGSTTAVTAAHVGVPDFDTKVAQAGIDGACYGCHAKGQAEGPADHGKRFPLPHPGRTGAPSVATCADCHTVRTSPQDVATLGCAACHDQRPTFAAAHAGVASFSGTSPACVRCHAGGEKRTLTGHVPFLLAPTADVTEPAHRASVLAGGDCFKCHPTQGTAETATAFAKPWAQDFRAASCGGCHLPVGPAAPVANHDVQAEVAAMHVATNHLASTSAFDAEVAAKGGWPAACFACHGDGTSVSLPPNHVAQLFPLPHPGRTGAPAVSTCADCHLDPLHRADVTTLGCVGCHQQRPTFAAAHSGVASYTATAAACVRCHPMGEHLTVAGHTPFLLAPTAAVTTVRHLASALGGGDCFQCHPTLGTPARTSPAMPAKAYAQDFRGSSCVTCHPTVGRATSTTADHGNQAALAALHVANGGVGTTAEFNTAVSKAGSLSAACLDCHGDGTAVAVPANHPSLFPLPHPGASGSPSVASCGDCHKSPADKGNLATLDCLTCHRARPTFAAAHPVGTYNFLTLPPCTISGETATCAPLSLASATSQTCLRCHAPSSSNAADPIMPRWLPGSAKTPAHGRGERNMNSGKHKNAGCLVCHTATRTVGGLYSAADFTKNVCTVCHTNGIPN